MAGVSDYEERVRDDAIPRSVLMRRPTARDQSRRSRFDTGVGA